MPAQIWKELERGCCGTFQALPWSLPVRAGNNYERYEYRTKHPRFETCDQEIIIHVGSYSYNRGPGSVVGIATGYGLDGPGIEFPEGGMFRTCQDRPWSPPSLLYNGYRVFSGGKERQGRDAFSAVVKKE